MRPSVTLTFAILLVAAATATAGEPVTVSAATERGRSLDRILDALLVPRAPVPEEGRTVALVVDPTSSLAAARFSAALRSALRRNASRLVDTRFSIVPVDRGSPDWTGRTGVITTLIPGMALDLSNTICCICGPPVM